jgi:hypothetical protein
MSGFHFADGASIKEGDLPLSLQELKLTFSSNIQLDDRGLRGLNNLTKLDLTRAYGFMMYPMMIEEDLPKLTQLAISRIRADEFETAALYQEMRTEVEASTSLITLIAFAGSNTGNCGTIFPGKMDTCEDCEKNKNEREGEEVWISCCHNIGFGQDEDSSDLDQCGVCLYGGLPCDCDSVTNGLEAKPSREECPRLRV